jgi:hypothetical protein
LRFSRPKKKPRTGLFDIAKLPSLRQHAHSLSLLIETIVEDDTVDLRKQCKVAPHSDIFPRVNARAELPHNDISGAHAFSTKYLHPTPLALAVSSVAGTPPRLFMSHLDTPLTVYRLTLYSSDFQRRLILPMSALAAVAFSPFFLENQHLLRLGLSDDPARDLRIRYERCADLDVAVAPDKQYISQGDAFADCSGQLFNFDQVTL